MNIKDQSPNQSHAGFFGQTSSLPQAQLQGLLVPWEPTVSYGSGTSLAPLKILKASHQLDTFHEHYGSLNEDAFKITDFTDLVHDLQKRTLPLARGVVQALEQGAALADLGIQSKLKVIRKQSEMLIQYIQNWTEEVLNADQIPFLIGGDHSCPLGLWNAVFKKHPHAGLLHIDAHLDMRESYEGFKFSHASVMYNFKKEFPESQSLHLFMRDFSEEEVQRSQNLNLNIFTDRQIQNKKAKMSWRDICREWLEMLPPKIHITLDIDGMDPQLAPGTGTPVPGGMKFQELKILLEEIVATKHQIVSFDLVEVSGRHQGDFDFNVGARALFELLMSCMASHKL